MLTGSITIVGRGTHGVQVGDYITVSLATPKTQQTSFLATGALTVPMIEQALDKLTNVDKELTLSDASALHFPVGDPASSILTSDRKGNVLAFDSNGSPTYLVPATVPFGSFFAQASSVAAMKALVYTSSTTGALIQLLGYYVNGDGGGGQFYVDKADTTTADNGGTVIVAADGTRLKAIWSGACNVKRYGAKGDGVTDDAAAINAAIYDVCKFTWRGTTRSTELGSTPGAVYFPAGRYRVTSKLLLAPGMRLFGDGTGNFFTEFGANNCSSIFVDYPSANYTDYALDTANYNASGTRVSNVLAHGDDSSNAVLAFCEHIVLENLHIIGTKLCSGLNLAGVPLLRIKNCRIANFVTGIRISACWGGGINDTYIAGFTFRGISTYADINGLNFNNVYLTGVGTSGRYNPSVNGHDAGEAPASSHWTVADNNSKTCGIYSYYGYLTGQGIIIESVDVAISSNLSHHLFTGIYCEGINNRFLQTFGSGFAQSQYEINAYRVSSNSNIIWSEQSQTYIRNMADYYSQGDFNHLYEAVFSGNNRLCYPIVDGFTHKNSGENAGTDGSSLFQKCTAMMEFGLWSPVLKFGGTASFTSVNGGYFQKIGNVVTCFITITTNNAPSGTGAATIAGLPYVISNQQNDAGAGSLSFVYNTGSLTKGAQLYANAYESSGEIQIGGATHANFPNTNPVIVGVFTYTTLNP
jgi:hypothetical protein